MAVTRNDIANNNITTVVKLVDTNPDREYIRLHNDGTVNVVVGKSSTLTATTGEIIKPGNAIEDVGVVGPYYAISATGAACTITGCEHIRVSVDVG